MKRKLTLGIATLLVLALGSAAALAHSATVTILSPTTGLHTVSSFPHVQDVAVKFVHGGTGQDLCGGDWSITVTGPGLPAGDDALSTGGSYDQTPGTPPTCSYGDEQTETWQNFSFPEPGTYTIYAKYDRTGTGHDGDATAEPEFRISELTLAYPAAPAIAASLLKDADVSARYGSGRTGGNCIADVAHAMGPGTTFNEVPKSQVAAYRDAVRDFLNGSEVNGITAPADCAVGS